MKPMKLLIEGIDSSSIEYLVEGKDTTEKTYKIRGAFMEAERKNKNGRIYPKPIMENEVNRYCREEIAEGRSVSSLDHPPTPEVKLSDAALIIDSLKFDGNIVIGEARALSTDKGRCLRSLMNDGVKFGMSSRALGSLGQGGIVSENFRLLAVDAVQNASAHAASIVESLVENFEYIISGDKIVQIAVENFQKDLAKNGSKKLSEDLHKFISSLRGK